MKKSVRFMNNNEPQAETMNEMKGKLPITRCLATNRNGM